MDLASSRWPRVALGLSGMWAAGAVMVPKGWSYGVVSAWATGRAAAGAALAVVAVVMVLLLFAVAR
ncbi:hypothetical protein [Streptomyces sp. XH2]|uniref:hypothetical protein n=1 Tax=Streptomyces sp. XH2 TaxID=3412483 RepID=UPI003C7D5B70